MVSHPPFMPQTVRPKTLYVILFTPRTGSTFFQYRLKSPHVIAENERLLPFFRDDNLSASEQGWAQIGYLLQAMSMTRSPDIKAYGLRVNLEYIQYPDRLAQLLRVAEARVFHVRRRNLLKNALSRYNQRRLIELTGKGELRREQDGFQLPPAIVDMDEFERDLSAVREANQTLETFVAELDLPTHLIDYEDLVDSEDTVASEAFKFLGVPDAKTPTPLAKVTQDDLSTAITNFDQFRERFFGTELEAMLD